MKEINRDQKTKRSWKPSHIAQGLINPGNVFLGFMAPEHRPWAPGRVGSWTQPEAWPTPSVNAKVRENSLCREKKVPYK
jgi:hypothetical protein